MASSESFLIVDGPPEHKLERALTVRDEGQRIVDFTIEFQRREHCKIGIPVSVNTLGQNKGGETSWVVGGVVSISSERDAEQQELLCSVIRWLGKADMPYYRAYYDAKLRSGWFGFSDRPLIIETIFDDPMDLARGVLAEILDPDSCAEPSEYNLQNLRRLLTPERVRVVNV